MALFRKNISAAGLGGVISDFLTKDFSSDGFDGLMSQLGVNSTEYNQMHAIEAMGGYLFQLWFALSKKGYESSVKTIIMDIVRENLLKSYFGESEDYRFILGHIIARINEYAEIFQKKSGSDAEIEFGGRFYCYVLEYEKFKPARKMEVKEMLDMGIKIDSEKMLKAHFLLLAFRKGLEGLLDEFKVTSML